MVGILAGVAAGAALAEEVPALVELDLVEAGLLLLVETFAGGLAFEGVLLLDQGADAVEDLLVVHGLLRVDLGWLPVMMGARATASADAGPGPMAEDRACEPGPSSWLSGRRGDVAVHAEQVVGVVGGLGALEGW